MQRRTRLAALALGAAAPVALVTVARRRADPAQSRTLLPPEALADDDSTFIDVDGLRVHAKVAGQGDPTVVLIHGFAAGAFIWRQVMPPLARRGTVVAFDLPGFGLTARPAPDAWPRGNPYDPEVQADLTVALLDRLGIDRAVLVGHSAGARVAMLAALRYSERVSGLVLVTPALDPPSLRRSLALLVRAPALDRLLPRVAQSASARAAYILRYAVYDRAVVTDELVKAYLTALQVDGWDAALACAVRAARPLGLLDRFGELQVPFMAIFGMYDRIVNPRQVVRMTTVPDLFMFVFMEHTGHLPPVAKPEDFVDFIEDFLNHLEQRASERSTS